MPCDQDPTTLGAYLDSELPADQLAAMSEHLESCPRCAVEITELARQQRSLRAARGHYTPSPAFKLKMRQQLTPPKPHPARTRIFSLIPLASALAAMLLVVIAWQYSRTTNAFTAVADLHINALASTNPLDVVSSDRHTVKPWFQGRIPFSFNVPEFAGTGFTLLGGRLVYLHQQPGAQLIVAMRQHKISVLIFPAISGLDHFLPLGVSHHSGFNVATWQSQELRFFIIGDADPSAIDKLFASVKQANQ